MDLYRQAEFLDGSLLLVTHRRIHGCSNKEAKREADAYGEGRHDQAVPRCPNKQEVLEASLKRIEDPDDDLVEASFACVIVTKHSSHSATVPDDSSQDLNRLAKSQLVCLISPVPGVTLKRDTPKPLSRKTFSLSFCGKERRLVCACFRKRATQHQQSVDTSLNPKQYYCEDDLLDLQSLSFNTATMQS